MRLGRILEVLKTQVPLLSIPRQQLPNTNNYRISKINEIRAAVHALAEVPALKNAANNLLGHLPISNASSQATVTQQVNQGIDESLEILKTQAQLLLATLSAVLPGAGPGVVYFRLPNENNLDELVKDVKVINDSFNQIFSGRAESLSVKFKGFDIGSEWLVFEIAPHAQTGFFLLVLNSAIFIARKLTAYQKEQQELEDRKHNDETKQKFRDVIDTILDGYAKDEARRIVEKFKKDPNDPGVTEDINRLANSLNNLAGLFSRGATVNIPIEAKTAETAAPVEELEKQAELLEEVAKPLLEHKPE